MSEGLRQRKPASEPGLSSVAEDTTASKSVDDLIEPDWALVFDGKSPTVETDVSKALATLSQAGFYVTLRRGASGTVLILVRAGSGLVAGTQSRASAVTKELPTDLPGVVDDFPLSEQGRTHLRLNARIRVSEDDLATIGQQYGGGVEALFRFFNEIIPSLAVPALLGIGTLATLGQYSFALTVGVLVWGAIFVARLRNYVEPSWGPAPKARVTPRRNYRHTAARTHELRRLWFVPLAIVLLSLYTVGLLAILAIEIFCVQLYSGPLQPVAKLVPVGANIAASIVFSLVYSKIIEWFSEWEDYPTEEAKYNANTQRQFYLQALLGYAPLVFSVYVYEPFGSWVIKQAPMLRRSTLGNYVSLRTRAVLDPSRLVGQATFYTVQSQFVALLTGLALPAVIFLYQRWKLPKQGAAGKNRFTIEQLRPQFNIDGHFSAVVLMFGYVLVLAPVWPLAGLAAFLGLWIRSKAVLYALVNGTRRPVNKRGLTLGFWSSDLQFLVAFASVVTPTIAVIFREPNRSLSLAACTSALPVFSIALASENGTAIINHIAGRYFRAIAPEPVTPVVQGNVYETPEQDAIWKKIDVVADLKNVFPKGTAYTKEKPSLN